MYSTAFCEFIEPSMFIPEVARTIAFRVLVSSCASFGLVEIIRKLVEYFNEHLPKAELVLPIVLGHDDLFTTILQIRMLMWCLDVDRLISSCKLPREYFALWAINTSVEWKH